MIKLNVGCGTDIRKNAEGWINIDKFAGNGVDKIIDLEKQSLFTFFEPNSINYIYCSHTLEHLFNYEQVFIDLMNLVTKDGIIEIKVPHYMNPKMHCFYHKRTFSLTTFNSFFLKDNTMSLEAMEINKKIILEPIKIELHWLINPKRKILIFLNNIVEKIINSSSKMQRYAEAYIGYHIGGFYEIHFIFKVIKND